MPDTLTLNLADGTAIVGPNSLASSTTYVLLEQGRWFEKEWRFLARWLRPGMTAIDIGANAGVYALPMARLLGPAGRVAAFEPAAETRARLLAGQAANGLDNLVVVDAALSDAEGSAHLMHGESSETNALDESGLGETVRLTTLDRAAAELGIGSPDFIKIDAEGVEDKVIAGGRALLTDASPVVLFELNGEAARTSSTTAAALRALGYGLYRMLEHGPILVPYRLGTTLDAFEVNLFAIKPDRAMGMEANGLIVTEARRWTARDTGLGELLAQPFAATFRFGGDVSPRYAQALNAYAASNNMQLSPAGRLGAVVFAYQTVGELCAEAPSLARLSTFARLALEIGERRLALGALRHAQELVSKGGATVDEPFWPASPRYDRVPPAGAPGDWLAASLVEQRELSRAHSSMFVERNGYLDWLTGTPFASDEMHRRHCLTALRSGADVHPPLQATRDSEGYRNGAAWAQLGRH